MRQPTPQAMSSLDDCCQMLIVTFGSSGEWSESEEGSDEASAVSMRQR